MKTGWVGNVRSQTLPPLRRLEMDVMEMGVMAGTSDALKGRPEGLPFIRDGRGSHYRARRSGPTPCPWDRNLVQTAEPKNGIPSPGAP